MLRQALVSIGFAKFALGQIDYLQELFTLHDTLVEGLADTLSSLCRVLVVMGAVDVAVAKLDRIVNRVGCVLLGDLPDTVANQWHVLGVRV